MKQLTWGRVYDDFKQRHPNLSAMAADYRAYDFATILIYLKDGSKLIYNYDLRQVRFLSHT